MIINSLTLPIFICLFFHILLIYLMAKLSEIFGLKGKIINLIVRSNFKKKLLFYINFVLIYLTFSSLLFYFKGITGVQIVNFIISFILIFEVCLRISDSERFINWIGSNLERSIRLFIMFIISLNGTYFFTRLTYQILTSKG